jgi:hypothetical protein
MSYRVPPIIGNRTYRSPVTTLQSFAALLIASMLTFPVPVANAPTPKFTVNVLPDTAVMARSANPSAEAFPLVGSTLESSPTIKLPACNPECVITAFPVVLL